MKPLKLRSIGTRLVALTSLLIVVTVVVIVSQWISSVRDLMYASRRDEAIATARTLSFAIINQIDDNNWSSIRVDIDLLMGDNPDLVYVVVHAKRPNDRVVAAAPDSLSEQFVPDIVSLAATRAATGAPGILEQVVPVLVDVPYRGGMRAKKGERVIEIDSPIFGASKQRLGTVRTGISLVKVDQEVAAAIKKAIALAGVALVLALIGGVVVARTLSRPIRRLAVDAAKIAGGDLAHRADVDRQDEIGALARGFNEMSAELEASFGKLRRTSASFERFVPRKFLKVVAPEGIENIVVGTAMPRRISVLFSDLRGFTSLSENLTPIQVFHLLNEYLAKMGAAIDEAGGFVDKYIGDAIMALFDEEHSDGLVRAVVNMRTALAELNAEREKRGQPMIQSGIGCHGGDVVMGTIGFASKIESTVIGDAVNVASRVEGMTKDKKVDVLITGQVVARLKNRDAFKLRLVESGVSVRGRDEPIDLYTVDI